MEKKLETIAVTPTLRDQFAMAALTGLWAGMQSDESFADTTCEEDAETCYNMADAMMDARALTKAGAQ